MFKKTFCVCKVTSTKTSQKSLESSIFKPHLEIFLQPRRCAQNVLSFCSSSSHKTGRKKELLFNPDVLLWFKIQMSSNMKSDCSFPKFLNSGAFGQKPLSVRGLTRSDLVRGTARCLDASRRPSYGGRLFFIFTPLCPHPPSAPKGRLQTTRAAPARVETVRERRRSAGVMRRRSL